MSQATIRFQRRALRNFSGSFGSSPRMFRGLHGRRRPRKNRDSGVGLLGDSMIRIEKNAKSIDKPGSVSNRSGW